MNVDLGGYHVGDIEIVAAFDVNAGKVGRDVAEAICAEPNNTLRFADVAADRRDGRARPDARRHRADTCATRSRNPTRPTADVADVLRPPGPTCWSPTCRSARSRPPNGTPSRRWRPAAPSSTASRCSSPPNPDWRKRFEERGLPIIGDDIKSQVGATIVHRVLANLFRERGVRLDRTYQLNFGGNTDFQNMLERERLESKKISKTQAVTSQLDVPLDAGQHPCRPERPRAVADRPQDGPTSGWRAPTFGGVPLNVELKLEVWDSPNSAGVVIDAVRCAKLALDRGIGGALIGPSSYFMKSPPQQFTDDEARERT